MKNLLKTIIGFVLCIVLIGTVGALEVGNISPLQCIVQGGICLAFLYIIFVFNGGSQYE